jgi:Cdc6-like AAA superfamily ATPase
VAAAIGRDREQAVVEEFVAASASMPAALAIHGVAGIGKTTICRCAIEQARVQGCHVLGCRPAQAESSLSFSALTDLLATVPDEVFEGLPEPQQRPLAIAALRQTPGDETLDERAVGTGLAALFQALSKSATTIIVVDDAHWMDEPTQAVLSFALRRSEGCPLGVIVSWRSDATRGSMLLESLPSPRWERQLMIGPVSTATIFHMVREELGVTLSRPKLARIAAVSGGNPFLALELARKDGVASTLVPLEADRVSRLTGDARRAVLAIACSPRPTPPLMLPPHAAPPVRR